MRMMGRWNESERHQCIRSPTPYSQTFRDNPAFRALTRKTSRREERDIILTHTLILPIFKASGLCCNSSNHSERRGSAGFCRINQWSGVDQGTGVHVGVNNQASMGLPELILLIVMQDSNSYTYSERFSNVSSTSNHLDQCVPSPVPDPPHIHARNLLERVGLFGSS